MKALYVILLLLASALISCKKRDDFQMNFHEDYFPLTQGTFCIYEAMKIQHDEQAVIQSDTTIFYLKTVIGETIVDLMGDTINKFYRYWKLDVNDAWEIKDVWTTKLKENRAELVEENVRLVKLVFPIRNDQIWDMNAFNTDHIRNVSYDDATLHNPKTFNGLTFDSTIRVNQRDFFSLVDHRKQFEVYAKGVGLIHKFYKDNSINNFDTLNIRIGTEIHYKIIDYGIE